jgi:hypothetical protein
VGKVEIGIADDKHASHKRVYKLPIKALLEIVQHMLLVHVQQVAHVLGGMHAHWVRYQQLRVHGGDSSFDQTIIAAKHAVNSFGREPHGDAFSNLCGVAGGSRRRPARNEGWSVSGRRSELLEQYRAQECWVRVGSERAGVRLNDCSEAKRLMLL